MIPPADLADTEPHGPHTRALSFRPSTVRLGSVPADSEQDLRFLRDRVALLGKTTFLISLMFLVATTAADVVAETKRYDAFGRASHVVGTLIALGLWQVARSRRRLSPRMLQAIDVAGTLGICWSFASMGHHALQPYGSYTALLAITHVSVSRAVIVPSEPRRSLLLGIASFAAFIASRASVPLPPDLVHVSGARARTLLEALLWSTAGSAVVTLTSKVIYGLQEKALEARQLGQYTLEEKIGEGGMGEVYRAQHAMLRRPTAVKLLAGGGSESQLRRFEKEVQLTARLTHPNTISIYDYGRAPDGVFYYAMELLDGLTLAQLVDRDGPQPPGRVIHILQQVCGALAEAHRVGMIHRDIKPANIHLCRRGDVPDFVKVLDFGLVRDLRSNVSSSLSNVNAVIGTPLYLSPEAIRSPDRLDGRADIYGLGCVAYFLLTGSPPFSGNNVVELCAHHLHTTPAPLSERHDVPEDLERVILACLAKDPAGRPGSARDLSRELQRCRDAQSWSVSAAEAWWTKLESPETAAAVTPRERAEQIPRTFRVDFEERFKRLEEVLERMSAEERR